MTLHFAYGSMMSRVLMGARCPGARALGTATLKHWRFIIGLAGHGSIVPRPGAVVHGGLWRVGAPRVCSPNSHTKPRSGPFTCLAPAGLPAAPPPPPPALLFFRPRDEAPLPPQ